MVASNYIAEKLRDLRKNAHLDVEAVGAAVDRSGKTVSAWETGRNVPSAEMLVKLCMFFGVDIDYFYPPEVSSIRNAAISAHDSDEQRLLVMYRSMDSAGRTIMMELAASIAERHPKNTASEMVS